MNSTLIKLSVLSLALMSAAAQADLVLKAGQVIGRDGEIYDGMSPQTREALEAQAEEGKLKSGVVNGSFYMMLNGVVSTVPLATLKNLESDERVELVKSTFSDDARAALEQEYRNQLSATRVENLNDDVETELEDHTQEMDRDLSRNLAELDDEIDREVEDHMHEMENEIEREIEVHMHEMENEIEREIENHMHEMENEIEHEIENHMSEIEHEVERHSEGHDDDHDEHDD